MRAAVAALVLVAVAAGLSACESTADKSARIAAAGRDAVQAAGTLKIRHNAEVRVARAVVVRGAGGAVAAAVEVRNAGARAQRDVPVLIDVRDARGASLYKQRRAWPAAGAAAAGDGCARATAHGGSTTR